MDDSSSQDLESGEFLSPEDSEALLASMESDDARFLGQKADTGRRQTGNIDEGSFIYPGQGEPPDPPGSSPMHAKTENPHTELLARIAREVHTIKAELGALAPQRGAESSQPAPAREIPAESIPDMPAGSKSMSEEMWGEIQRLLAYLDRLLESLPEDKVDEFVHSEYFELYRKVFDYFGLT